MMNTYPVLRFTARHGAIISWLGALFVLGAGGALALEFSSPVVMVIAVCTALVMLGILYSYTELVRIIAETLLPR